MSVRIASLLFILTFFSADSAGAYFEIDMKFRPGTDVAQLDTSETVTVDVFFSTDEPGMMQLGVRVVSAETVTYDPGASLALPVIYPAPPLSNGTTGAQSAYILYGVVGKSPTAMYALQDHPIAWPTPAPGTNETVFGFQIPSLEPAPGVGDDLWLASIVFHLGSGFRTTTLTPEVAAIQHRFYDIIPPPVTLSAPLTFQVPEPGTAVLIGLGVAACALANRRRASLPKVTSGVLIRFAQGLSLDAPDRTVPPAPSSGRVGPPDRQDSAR